MNLSFKTTILVKKPLEDEFNDFEYILPFVLPQGLVKEPYTGDKDRLVYMLNYKLNQITSNIQNISRNTPITNNGTVILDVDTDLNLDKYLFIMYDSHCNGTNTEFLITLSKV